MYEMRVVEGEHDGWNEFNVFRIGTILVFTLANHCLYIVDVPYKGRMKLSTMSCLMNLIRLFLDF